LALKQSEREAKAQVKAGVERRQALTTRGVQAVNLDRQTDCYLDMVFVEGTN